MAGRMLVAGPDPHGAHFSTQGGRLWTGALEIFFSHVPWQGLTAREGADSSLPNMRPGPCLAGSGDWNSFPSFTVGQPQPVQAH